MQGQEADQAPEGCDSMLRQLRGHPTEAKPIAKPWQQTELMSRSFYAFLLPSSITALHILYTNSWPQPSTAKTNHAWCRGVGCDLAASLRATPSMPCSDSGVLNLRGRWSKHMPQPQNSKPPKTLFDPGCCLSTMSSDKSNGRF